MQKKHRSFEFIYFVIFQLKSNTVCNTFLLKMIIFYNVLLQLNTDCATYTLIMLKVWP